MMIARWTCQAEFGHQREAQALLMEWNEQIGSQSDIDMADARMLVGSVGAREATIQMEPKINNLADLDVFLPRSQQSRCTKFGEDAPVT